MFLSIHSVHMYNAHKIRERETHARERSLSLSLCIAPYTLRSSHQGEETQRYFLAAWPPCDVKRCTASITAAISTQLPCN
jgi:hypothetical protein